MQQLSKLALGLLLGAGMLASNVTYAACSDITYAQLQTAASNVYSATAAFSGVSAGSSFNASNNLGGFYLNMWVTMVDETGMVCHVVNTGTKGALAGNSQWLGSRIISAQKANTANAFSLNNLSISSGALYAAVQPGGSLFGLQESNPVNATFAYLGNPAQYGTINDPIKFQRLGGVNVFGGGLALYKNGVKIGAIGVSGDTSCTDHAFAWKVRSSIGGTNYAYASESGNLEKLTIVSASTSYSALGQHPLCANDDTLEYTPNAASKGFVGTFSGS